MENLLVESVGGKFPARHLLLPVGSGNIDQSEDFIAMMHD